MAGTLVERVLSTDNYNEREYAIRGLAEYGGPRSPDDPAFWDDPIGKLPGALYTPDAGYVSDPQLAAQNLADAATAGGAVFRFRSEVTSIRSADGRIRASECPRRDLRVLGIALCPVQQVPRRSPI